MDENKIRLAESELLETSVEELAKGSVKEYKKISIRQSESVSDSKVKTHYMKGLFANEDVNWDLIKPNLKEYKEERDPLGLIIEKKMGMEKENRIFPPIIERDFREKPDAIENFCKVKIRFDPKILSKSEAISHLGNIREEANEDKEWAQDLIAWLKSEKGYKFYFIVGFEIICEYDFKEYWTERSKKISKDKEKREISEMKAKGVSVSSDEKKSIADKMQREGAELAEYAVEYVVEKLVYKDLRDAFKNMCEAIEKKKKQRTPN